MATCRSCGRAIVWVRMANTGKLMPVDANPVSVVVPSGVALDPDHDGRETLYRVARGFVSHFATCPYASQHRKS